MEGSVVYLHIARWFKGKGKGKGSV